MSFTFYQVSVSVRVLIKDTAGDNFYVSFLNNAVLQFLDEANCLNILEQTKDDVA